MISNPDKLISFYKAYSSILVKTTYGYNLQISNQKSIFIPIKIISSDLENTLSFEWNITGENTYVDITTEPVSATLTLLKVKETGWKKDENGLNCYNKQMKVWYYFLIRLKLYLEQGLHLNPIN